MITITPLAAREPYKDAAAASLITVIDLVIYTIEFKEPGAKTSEPDLPKYGEDGFLVVNDKWLEKKRTVSRNAERTSRVKLF